MANDITIKLRVDDQGSVVIDRFASANARKLQGFTQKAGSDLDRMSANIQKNWASITAGAAAITAGVYQLKAYVDAYMQAEKASNSLAVAQANAGRLTRESVRDLKDYAAAVQVATGADDDLVVAQMAVLQTFRSVNGGIGMTADQLKNTYAAAADLATARGISLEAAVMLLGKAFAGNTTTLGRYGIVVSETIPQAEKFQAVLDAINASVGGSAAAQMNTHAGQVQYLGAVYGDVGERIGQVLVKIVEAGLMLSNAMVYAFSAPLAKLYEFGAAVDTVLSKLPLVGEYFRGEAIDDAATGQAWGQMAENASAEMAKLFEMIKNFDDPDYTKLYKNQVTGLGEMGAEAEKTKKKTMDLAAEMKRLEDIMGKARDVNATAGMDEWAQKEYEITQRWLNVIEQMTEQATKLGMSADDISALRVEIETARQNKLLELNQQRLDQEQADAERYAEDQAKLLKEQEDASRETYDTMAGFFRDALVQMDGDAGSFVDSILSKLKNLAASVAANAASSLIMSAGRSLLGLVGGGGGLRSMLGMVGGGSGGSGFDLMSMLSGGKTANSLYGGISGGSFYNTLGAGYAPGEIITDAAGNIVGTSGGMGMGINWLGAGAGVAGVGFGGYGMYNAYKAGSPGSGALAGAGAGLGVTGAMASGMLGSAAAGAAAGSWAPVIGTAIGAIVGAAVGALGMSAAKKEVEKQRLAANYMRGVGRAANADISQMSLGQYVAGGSSVFGSGATEAAIAVGGLKGNDISSQLLNLIKVGGDYKDAVEQMGGASAQAIGQFSRVQSTMSVFAMKSAQWTGDAAGLAQQWLKIGENIKELQIKELTTNLQQGIGIFSSTIDKLREVGMDEKAFNELVSAESLKFLTTDTMPALYGELSKVRDEFRKAAEAAKEFADQEAAASIKAQILTSDMGANLTEAELMGLKYGKVNTDLIAMYTALGWTDVRLTLVSAGSRDLAGVWEALSDAGKTLRADLDGIAAMYKDVDADSIPKAAMQAYGALTQLAATLDLVGAAGEKLSGLPDMFEAMAEAMDAGDLAAYNAEILKLTDALMYASGAAGALGMGKIGDMLGSGGNALAYVYGIIEVLQLLQRTTEHIVQTLAGNEDIYNWMVSNLEKIAQKYPKFAAKWLGIVNGGDDLTGTINQYANMDVSGAISVGQKYLQANPYTQQNQIASEAAAAIKVFQDQITEYEKGGVTYAEQQSIKAARAFIDAITEGASDASDAIMESFTKPFDDIIKSIQDKINAYDNSAYNVFLNPSQMTANLGGDFRSELAQFKSASPEDMSAAYGDLSSAADQYLQQALATYRSSSTYQAIYAEVMSALEQAKGMVGDKKDAYLSKYENDQITYTTAIADNTEQTNKKLVKLWDKIHELIIDARENRKRLVEAITNDKPGPYKR